MGIMESAKIISSVIFLCLANVQTSYFLSFIRSFVIFFFLSFLCFIFFLSLFPFTPPTIYTGVVRLATGVCILLFHSVFECYGKWYYYECLVFITQSILCSLRTRPQSPALRRSSFNERERERVLSSISNSSTGVSERPFSIIILLYFILLNPRHVYISYSS